MKAGPAQGVAEADADEKAVVDYIRAHPEIFVRHRELAAELQIPHACGDAVSLMEHQVSVLRSQNHQLREKLQELIGNARDNEDLNQRLHRLTLSLIGSDGIDEVFANLYEALRENFQAESVVIRIFVPPEDSSNATMAEFSADPAVGRELFEGALRSLRPASGRLSKEQKAFLFGGSAEEVGSALLLPLGQVHAFGLLAIGSRDEHKFHPAMATTFLRHLADVASEVLVSHLHRA